MLAVHIVSLPQTFLQLDDDTIYFLEERQSAYAALM